MIFKRVWIINCDMLLDLLSIFSDGIVNSRRIVELVLYAQVHAESVNHHSTVFDVMNHGVDALSIANDYLDEYVYLLHESERECCDIEQLRKMLRWVHRWLPVFDSGTLRHFWRGSVLVVEITR